MTRTFEDKPATREKVPLLLGLIGPSGGGKTFSALRLATGIQRINGGDIYFIDTEARRALHYADRFKFRHIEFGAPFGSLDYLAAIEHCVSKGAGIVIVDSMSHEHEGPGGLLEQHEQETARLAKAWGVSESKAQMSAWGPAKANRRRMINTILQMPCSFIFCFRAKNKLKIERGKDPVPMGFMPIAGEEFVFEMMVNHLLLPGANGVPTWQSEEPGEKQMIKLPEQFREVYAQRKALDEFTGEELAKWANGAGSPKFEELHRAIAGAETLTSLEALTAKLAETKDKRLVPPHEFQALRLAFAEQKKALESSGREPGED